jgi:hypothetical protein
MMTILSREPDGLGHHYGYLGSDSRQINVRKEQDGWVAYVHGDRIGAYETKDIAEQAAIDWIKANPEPESDEC